MPLQCSRQKAFGSSEASPLAGPEPDRVVVAVNGAIQVHPCPVNFDVRLAEVPFAEDIEASGSYFQCLLIEACHDARDLSEKLAREEAKTTSGTSQAVTSFAMKVDPPLRRLAWRNAPRQQACNDASQRVARA
jgi:hypothetical protein